MQLKTFWISGSFAVSVLLGACGSMPDLDDVLPDQRVEYKKEKQAEADLEIPPDLTRSSINDALTVPDIVPSSSATYSEYIGERRPQGTSFGTGNAVLPTIENITLEKDGSQRWLKIDAPPEQVWPQVVGFWRDNGILLIEEDPTVGVMKTGWIENRADIRRDFITDAVRRLFDGLYASATRDQYRVRLERGDDPGTTELYLTHRGLEEQIVADRAGNPDNTYFAPRPNDPGLEMEMMRRLMVYLGVEEKKAERVLAQRGEETERSTLIKSRDGSASLRINEGFARAWRLAGVALDRVGFAVEDRDRSRGIYYVRYSDPLKDQKENEGILSKLAFWKGEDEIDESNQYQVKLEAGLDDTRVTIRDKDGNPEISETATRILTLLHEQIR